MGTTTEKVKEKKKEAQRFSENVLQKTKEIKTKHEKVRGLKGHI